MIIETGQFALILALALACFNAIVPLWGVAARDSRLMGVAPSVALAGFGFVALSYAALTYAHVTSDFSLLNVYENSASAKPMIYKITGVWGNHEGSMLLWVLILAVFAAAVSLSARTMPRDLNAAVLAVQSWISAAFLLFILLTSNPFTRLPNPPIEGQDLNPLLQDPGLAIHPPLLYLGYVGLSVTFAFAAGALICGRIDAVWARLVRPWTLIAWIFLTLGIAMGSYWAYYTLGWGGFWFWDPVENASLMPWLAATALLHSATVMEKREALKVWTIFLAILAFSLSLIGTFIVRSGVLTSVHSFANDPRRGVFILAILVFFIGGALLLFALRANTLKPGGFFAPISREGALVFNNLVLTTICATVFVGELYPLALESLTGEKISVGGPFFDFTVVPLFLPLALLMPVGQNLAWKRGDFLGAAQRLYFALLCGLALMLVLASWHHNGPLTSIIVSGLGLYVILGAFAEIISRSFGRTAVAKGGLLQVWRHATGLPLSTYGTALAHAGIGVSLLGLAATGWGAEKIMTMKPGDSAIVGPYQLVLTGIDSATGPNFTAKVGHVVIRAKDKDIAAINPAVRFYPTRQMSRAEAGIKTLNFGQVYVGISDGVKPGTVDARLYWKPLVTLIWIGALIMGFGGFLSLSDRRLRIGVAHRVRKLAGAQQAPAE